MFPNTPAAMKTNRSKRLPLLLYTSVSVALAAVAALNFMPSAVAANSGQSTNAPPAEDDDSAVLDPKPYDLAHYDRMLGKSPFDFDAPPAPPPAAVRPMEGWAQAGISITSDYMSATLVNLKNPNERVRLTRYLKPEDQALNNRPRYKPKSSTAAAAAAPKVPGRGTPPGMKIPAPAAAMDTDDLKLLDIEFEQGKTRNYRHAIAVVSKAGVQDRVEYDEQVAQIKPAGPQMGNLNLNRGVTPGPGGGNPAIPPTGAVPQPGQGAPNNPNNNNAALMQLLQTRGQGAAGQPQANPQAPPNPAMPQTQPQAPVQVNTQPAIPALAPNNTPAAPQNQHWQNGGEQRRRRVVLPTPEAQPARQ